MFEGATVAAVLAASDLARARRWWADVLEHDAVEELGEEAFVIEVGDARVMVYRSQFAGTAQNTVLTIVTDDLDRDMAALRERGVAFNDYDLPGLATVDGVADLDGERSAWFTDPEGNIVSLAERT